MILDFFLLLCNQIGKYLWVFLLVSSCKVSCHEIKDLGFKFHLHKKINWYLNLIKNAQLGQPRNHYEYPPLLIVNYFFHDHYHFCVISSDHKIKRIPAHQTRLGWCGWKFQNWNISRGKNYSCKIHFGWQRFNREGS